MPEMPSSAVEAAIAWLNELAEVINSTGRHEGHTLRKIGRCVHCSCGIRYQGNLPAKSRKDTRNERHPDS